MYRINSLSQDEMQALCTCDSSSGERLAIRRDLDGPKIIKLPRYEEVPCVRVLQQCFGCGDFANIDFDPGRVIERLEPYIETSGTGGRPNINDPDHYTFNFKTCVIANKVLLGKNIKWLYEHASKERRYAKVEIR